LGWCLDKPCLVNKNDPTKATCACTAVKDQGPYVTGADAYTDKLCTTGLISSATVTQITQVTDFLKETSQFSHIDLKFVNKRGQWRQPGADVRFWHLADVQTIASRGLVSAEKRTCLISVWLSAHDPKRTL
jgi:hypothetical protein